MQKDNLFLEDSKILLNTSSLKKKELVKDNINITEIDLTKEEAKKINRDKGKYITISFSKDSISKNIETLIELVINSIKSCLDYLEISKKAKVLFVGLGNKSFSCDKLGYLTIEKIVANNKTHKIYKDAYGITNIKSLDFVKSLVNTLDIDLVVIIDSLKAENLERLGTTIQLSTSGISPGSARDKRALVLSKKTIKSKVLSIGVPSIINMKSICEDNPSLLITTDDIDEIVENSSSILSIAINRLF